MLMLLSLSLSLSILSAVVPLATAQSSTSTANNHVDFTEILDPDYDDSSSDGIDPFLGMVSNGLLMLKEYIHSTSTSTSTTNDNGSNTLNINTLLEGLLDDDGRAEFVVDGGFWLDLGVGSGVNLTSVSVQGLDTFLEANLLRPTLAVAETPSQTQTQTLPGINAETIETTATATTTTTILRNAQTTVLQNTFKLDTLVLDLFLTEFDGDSEEKISVRLPFRGVAVSSMPVNLALKEEGLRNYPLGAALELGNLLPCLRANVLDAPEILKLEVSAFDTIGVPSLLTTSAKDPTQGSAFFDLVTTLFVVLPSSVPIFFNSTIRGLLNDVLQGDDDDDDDDDDCPSFPSTVNGDNDLVDFRTFFDNGLPAVLMGMLKDQLLAVNPDTGLPKINEVLIAPMMEELGDNTNTSTNDNQRDGSRSGIGSGSGTDTSSVVVFGSGEEGLLAFNTSIALGGLSADVAFKVSDLRLQNLDTLVPPLDLLEPLPQNSHQLNNIMTMGSNLDIASDVEMAATATTTATTTAVSSEQRPMGVSANVFLSIETQDSGSIEHNLKVQTTTEALSLDLTLLLEVVQAKLYSFPLQDVTNLQCWVATLNSPSLNNTTGIRLDGDSPTAGIADLGATLTRMNLDIACLGNEIDDNEGEGGIISSSSQSESESSNCTSSGMEEWVDLLSTSNAQAGVTESMSDVLDYAADLLSRNGAVLQIPIDRFLSEAPMQCPHSPEFNPEFETLLSNRTYEAMGSLPELEYSYGQLVLWGSIALVVVVAIVAAGTIVRCCVRRKHRSWRSGNGNSNSNSISADQRRQIAKQQKEEKDLEDALNASTSSMFSSKEIPLLVRWGMPLIIVGNIALFLSGHLNLGATVYIEANLAGDTIKVDNFFDFSIYRSTIDIWKAGGKSLAILILVFSGIWPYTKQLLTLVLWFLPTSRMSISTRGSFWIWIDRLAKWSMIDIFVIVVCIAAFRVSIQSPELAFLPDGFYSIDLMVVPMWGLYSNMTAQIVSQVSSHFIIYYHRCIVAKATRALQPQTNPGKKDVNNNSSNIKIHHVLRSHAFSNPHFQSTEKLVAKNWVSYCILASCSCMGSFIALGGLIPSFSVEILGIFGVAVEFGQEFEEAITTHSVTSIVAMLFQEAKFLDTIGDYIGVGILGCLVATTVMVVPILQALVLCLQWFGLLAQKGRTRLSVINEVLQAWQYVEVYLIALFVASWQLGPVSQYMFNAYCGPLDEFFAQMVLYGILKEVDAQCFSVQGSIDPGSIVLLAAAILLAFVNSVVTLANKQCLEEYHHTPSAAKEDNENIADAEIRRIPVVFTDAYRWFLVATESTETVRSIEAA